MEEFIELLNEIRDDVDFEAEEELFDDGILSSMDVIQIVAMIEEEYDVKIKLAKLRPENFNSAKAMWELIEAEKNA